MSEPWFSDPNTFGAWWGGLVGGVGGSLIGLLGGLAGWLLPRGIGGKWFQAGFALFAILGYAVLVVGLVALATGQPYAVWYVFLLTGVLFGSLGTWGFFYIRRLAHRIEQRRLQSEAMRHS